MLVADIVTIETPGLGDRSYLAHDGDVAVVVDPQRDIDRVTALVEALGVRVTHVFETHLHNDYVTGGLALARQTGAEYVVAAADEVAFERRPVADGDRVSTGRLTVTALHTPGHTPNHMSYALSEDGETVAVFTGGSMLFGAVGRTDLIGEEMTDRLTRAQYRSVRRLATELPEQASVLPTHGFGSFCSASETSGDSSTIGHERRHNIALVTDDEDRFVEELLGGLGAYPRYYAHMGGLNAAGPAAPDLSPPEEVDADELRKRVEAGEWVVDLRQRRAFARLHLAGTVSIELGDSFATYFGWALPWEAPVTLVGDSVEQVAEARRQLARIGVDGIAGAAVGDAEALAGDRRGGYRVAKFADLAEAFDRDDVRVLDVRRRDEWEQGHLAGALHVPFWELPERVDELPGGEIWIHCLSGYRASIAASLVDRAGRTAVLVDDDWARAAELGLPIEAPS
ncbi:MBL fold metallo-hydrolase [Acidimicrobiaceae bacterium USS-CC1]|uniref:MBL fold metallo-hydrolase n=1 Tax=Acidiferrimicrobium australe TaxID=2664430 RepID=A0ABW9QPB7_9ACTN|nr:MBL fold metallo-hydrolase [Acidiferrimicrobium australe]